MPDRFFSDTPITPTQTVVTLRGDESQHLAVVLRAKAGTEILVFDGSGAEWPGRVTAVSKSAVEVELGPSRAAESPRSTLTLAVALPKGDRQKWLVEKCVELGVTRLVPLLTARGVAQPVESALARLKRAVIEASKQSGQLRLLEIAEPRAWNEYVKNSLTPANPAALRGATAPRPRDTRVAVERSVARANGVLENLARLVAAGCASPRRNRPRGGLHSPRAARGARRRVAFARPGRGHPPRRNRGPEDCGVAGVV
jgi:RsmE family RNA methyltransferase